MAFGAIIAARNTANVARFMSKGSGTPPDPEDDNEPEDDSEALLIALIAAPFIIFTIIWMWP